VKEAWIPNLTSTELGASGHYISSGIYTYPRDAHGSIEYERKRGGNRVSIFSESLYKELSQRLARKDKHANLLNTLLQWLEEGGGEAMEDGVKELVKRIRGE